MTLAIRIADMESLARDQGLEFVPVSFEVVPADIMTEVASYGLPTRARHWSYGKTYQSQKLYGTMGLSKIYEIVLNNDPSIAFLLDTNPDIANLLVAAHVFGHVDFFTNNALFAPTNRNMVNDAVAHALRIDGYIERYGLETVEHLMDIGFALDRHIDPYIGVTRQRYPPRRIVEHERHEQPYDDLLAPTTPSISYVVEGDRIPPHPEADLLWFLIHYAPLEDWQKDVLSIIREESYYFYPQYLTKVINEGFAARIHAELFYVSRDISPTEMLDFAQLHASVVNPGGRFGLNPYYLGYTILMDIERRWDDYHAAGESNLTGCEKVFEVRATDDDISLVRNYLTTELVQRMKLFAYGAGCTHPPGQTCLQCKDVILTSRERDKVIEALVAPKYNYGAPRISIADANNTTLCLIHEGRKSTYLDRKYTTQTLAYLAELWGQRVQLVTSHEQGHDTILEAKPPGK